MIDSNTKKHLEDFGYQQMDKKFNGDNIPSGCEYYHLYLRYILIITDNSFYFIDYKGFANKPLKNTRPCHTLFKFNTHFELLRYSEDYFGKQLEEMKRDYRDYKLGLII